MKHVKLTQEQASMLILKLRSITEKSVFLYFIDKVDNYSGFDATILPWFLKFCVKNNMEPDCLATLTRLILRKSPECDTGMNLINWKKYPIDFKEYNSNVINMFMDFINIDNDLLLDNFGNYFCALVCYPHMNCKISNEIVETLENKFIFLTNLLNNSDETKMKLVLFLLNATFQCIIHLNVGLEKLDKLFREIAFEKLLPLSANPNLLSSLKILSLGITALTEVEEVITMDILRRINYFMHPNFSSPFHEVSTNWILLMMVFNSLSLGSYIWETVHFGEVFKLVHLYVTLAQIVFIKYN